MSVSLIKIAPLPRRQTLASDIKVGGRYLHRNGSLVREILAIDKDSVIWQDRVGLGSCTKATSVKTCPYETLDEMHDHCSSSPQVQTIEQPNMKKPFLLIINNHAEECGTPPQITNTVPKQYVGYIQNAFGEQWVFVYERKSRVAELRGRDIAWETIHSVTEEGPGDLLLGPEERQWLAACWQAVRQSNPTHGPSQFGCA